MQSEIAVENCHLALSVMEWCGQEKRGAAFPPPQKVYCCLYFSTPRLAKGSGLYISSWSRGGCYLKCLYRQGSRGSWPETVTPAVEIPMQAIHISLAAPCHQVPLSLPLRRWMHWLRCLSWPIPHVVCFWGVLDTFLFEAESPVAKDGLELTK